jgi:hypothetical protein
VAANGDIYVGDVNASGNSVVRVNPSTGAQTVTSSGGNFSGPWGVAISGP